LFWRGLPTFQKNQQADDNIRHVYSSFSVVTSAILRGPRSLGLLSSRMDGKKRRIMNAHKARIKRMKTCGVEIGFGINLHPT
jgi:hypothetical protein